MFSVPAAFAQRRISVSGEPGRLWIESLPEKVSQLCDAWGLKIDGAVMSGELGIVLPVLQGNDARALKVSWPDKDSAFEAFALSAWGGQGAVHLVAFDAELGALLLERADRTRPLSAIPVDEALVVAGRLLRTLAIPAPLGPPTLDNVAAGLARSMARLVGDRSEGRSRGRRIRHRAASLEPLSAGRRRHTVGTLRRAGRVV